MPKYDSIAFYIVAHQDDWQLFMSPNAYHDLNKAKRKVVFIYTTAGEAGKGEKYWKAREKGALASIRFVLDTGESPPKDVSWSKKTYCGHPITYAEYKDTRSYFLRLPDGRMTGKGSLKFDRASLTKLRKDKIDSIDTVDDSTTYEDWDDLCQTVAEIVKSESKNNGKVWINTSDYVLADNFVDNADHTGTGRIVMDVVDSLDHGGSDVGVTLYRDYDVDLLPPNLTPKQVHWKTGLFMAYDLTVQAESGHCTRCENRYYTGWCLRQYYRPMQKGQVSSALGKVWAHSLKHFTRLRQWRGAKAEAITNH